MGWFSYVPLAGPDYAPGKRADFWAQLITFTEVSALAVSVELIVTIFKARAPAMSLNRMPLFVWSMLVTAFMIRWIRQPHSVDPQTAMPETGVTEKDGRDIAAYLYTLR